MPNERTILIGMIEDNFNISPRINTTNSTIDKVSTHVIRGYLVVVFGFRKLFNRESIAIHKRLTDG